MMKILVFFTIFITKELIAADIKPAFAKPNFSNSYLPATMQVILHAVEQLKQEDIGYNTNVLISSSPHPPGLTTWQIVSKTGNDIELTTSSDVQMEEIYLTKRTPEHKENITLQLIKNGSIHTSFLNNTQELELKSKVKEIHEAEMPLNSVINEKIKSEESTMTYKFESHDENKNNHLRIELPGEKYSELARSSLISYLMRSQIPLRASLQQLAFLYDALNKDARRQGFVIYTGYSDDVIKTLSSSIKGGIGLQLKKILEKTVERSDLTRDDAKIQAKKAIVDLQDSNSYLSIELRRLLPLRYIP